MSTKYEKLFNDVSAGAVIAGGPLETACKNNTMVWRSEMLKEVCGVLNKVCGIVLSSWIIVYMLNVVYVVLSSNLCCKGNHLFVIVHDQCGIMEHSS